MRFHEINKFICLKITDKLESANKISNRQNKLSQNIIVVEKVNKSNGKDSKKGIKWIERKIKCFSCFLLRMIS